MVMVLVSLRGGIGPQESFLDLFQAEQLRRSLETIGPGESLRQKCVALKEIVEDKHLTRMGVLYFRSKRTIFVVCKTFGPFIVYVLGHFVVVICLT